MTSMEHPSDRVEHLLLQILQVQGETLDLLKQSTRSGGYAGVTSDSVDSVPCAVEEETADTRLCDFCYTNTECFPCPFCEKEWYCSDKCRQLRLYAHASRCQKIVSAKNTLKK
ncbi:hypothetical protein AGDE_03635 [Angomonas deanei]|uniref:MYND-type domain-containing protein n=1 Tax=Angomonas deanei TaxID=59799 RepID=A0A7G2CNZ0_9TRYP|nr:hypothetical protein AGDE_03635 [Angomonas deanei]CAD2221079.1 hypothetical protein, conserved [Angomonas deanei]|eukprot:EPY40293.1 hypothetical protein AGDE_03635 [Angomonas deanei]